MRIPDYPAPAAALDGTENVPIWESGQQRSIPLSATWGIPYGQTFNFYDGAGTKATWQVLSGNVLRLLGTDATGALVSLIRIGLHQTPFCGIDCQLAVQGLISHSMYGNVAGLPPASSYPTGRWFVNDATATTFGSIVAGGGTNFMPIFSDGLNWRIG